MFLCEEEEERDERRGERCAKFEMQTLNYHAFLLEGGKKFSKKKKRKKSRRELYKIPRARVRLSIASSI